MTPGIGRNASCALGDYLTSRPEGRSRPRELWFSIYLCLLSAHGDMIKNVNCCMFKIDILLCLPSHNNAEILVIHLMEGIYLSLPLSIEDSGVDRLLDEVLDVQQQLLNCKLHLLDLKCLVCLCNACIPNMLFSSPTP